MFYTRKKMLFFAFFMIIIVSSAAFADTDSDHFFRMLIENDISGVKQLIARGFEINKVYLFNEKDRTPLLEAIKKGRVKIVEMLLDAGADTALMTFNDYTPLMFAVTYATFPVSPAFTEERQRDAFRILEILLEQDVDFEYVNYWGSTAFSEVLYGSEYESTFAVTKILLRSGAKINPELQKTPGWEKKHGWMSPLTCAIMGALGCWEEKHENRVELIKFMLNEGADPNGPTGPSKVTPLHVAAAFDYEISKLLIDAGADKNARDSKGRRPFNEALARWDIPTMKLLF